MLATFATLLIDKPYEQMVSGVSKTPTAYQNQKDALVVRRPEDHSDEWTSALPPNPTNSSGKDKRTIWVRR